MIRFCLSLLMTTWLFSTEVAAHPGGLDNNGGHTNRKTSEYHCHKDPCNDIHKQVEDATNEALSENLPVTLIYRREDWRHWIDADGDCMNTRHEILLAQAVGEVKRSPDGCYISTGIWHDPYSGKTYTRASDLDIDHVIPLKWANDHGGSRWSPSQKEMFANDSANLLAVDDGLNQQKGAQGPDQWLPPNQGYRCEYLAHWKRLLDYYSDLKMTAGEFRVFNKQLEACGF